MIGCARKQALDSLIVNNVSKSVRREKGEGRRKLEEIEEAKNWLRNGKKDRRVFYPTEAHARLHISKQLREMCVCVCVRVC